jgi:hypothetical protein
MRKLIIALVLFAIAVILILAIVVKFLIFTVKALGNIEQRKTSLQERSEQLSQWKR